MRARVVRADVARRAAPPARAAHAVAVARCSASAGDESSAQSHPRHVAQVPPPHTVELATGVDRARAAHAARCQAERAEYKGAKRRGPRSEDSAGDRTVDAAWR